MLEIAPFNANRGTACMRRASRSVGPSLDFPFRTWRLCCDVGQRDKFSKASACILQLSDGVKVGCPVLGSINMPEHDGRGRFEADFVRGPHDFQPLRCVEFVGTDLFADLVVQNLCCSAG